MARKFEDKIKLGDDGLIFQLPSMPPEKEIEGYELPTAKQKFKRKKFLSEEQFAKLEKSSQLEILTTELTRRTHGYWFFNNGVPTHLTGSHYFYLYYWYMAAITDDGMPEYREAQKKWFYFIEHCEQDETCFGGIMMSGKRFSKTEGNLAHLYNVATRGGVRIIGGKTIHDEDALFGMQSLKGEEAKKNLFKGRVLRSHRRIPNYLKPKSNDSIGKSEISSELTFFGDKKGDNSTAALNNIIDWRVTNESAYQGKRPREVYWDEPGTIEEMDIVEALTTVKQQLQIGKRAFGKIFMPATLESMTPKGAPLFQKIWNESDPNSRDANGRTQSWLYRYFNPQYEGREDFIDEYGNSLIDEAKKFRQNELDAATEDGARKVKRQYPETPDEAFDVVTSGKIEEDVIELLKVVRQNLVKEIKMGNVNVKCVKFFETDTVNYRTLDKLSSREVMIYEEPRPNVKYVLGIDGTGTDDETSSNTGNSEFSFCILKAFEGVDQYNYTVVCDFSRRPEKTEDVYYCAYYAAKYFNKFGGMIDGVLPETNQGGASAIVAFFTNRGERRLLKHAPKQLGTDGEKRKTFGVYRDDHVKDMQVKLTNPFLRLHGKAIRSLLLIDDIFNVGKKNADRADAFMMAVLALGNYNKEAKPKPKPIIHSRRTLKKIGGRNVVVWVKENVGIPQVHDKNEVPDYKSNVIS